MGNVKSVYNALKFLGATPTIVDTPSKVDGDKIIIPGVGAFGEGMNKLRRFIPKLERSLDSGIPLLGICLGLEVFFEVSEESPNVDGWRLMGGES